MAPAKTPRRPKPESDYGNVGVKGRRTGVVLKDTGLRDEHGLEPIDGIFSSPQKPLPRQNGVTQNSTIMEDDSMDTGGSSTMPGPVEMLQEARNGKVLLPPRSRSPIKTSLGSSPRRTPRRSVGPRSSSSQPTTKSTPTRAASHPLNYTPLGSQNEVTPTIELSAPNGQKSRPKKPKKISTNGKGVKRVFNLSLADDDDDEDDEDNDQDENQSSVLNGVDDSIGVMRDDTGLLGNEDETNQVPLDEDIPEAENNQPFDVTVEIENVSGATEAIKSTITIPKRHAGRPPKVPPVNHDSLVNPNGSESPIAPRKNRGRPKKEKPRVQEDPQIGDSQIGNPQTEESQIRDPQTEDPQIRDPQIEDSQIKDPQIGSSRDIEEETSVAAPPRKKQKGLKAAVAPKDLNIKMKPPPKPNNRSTLEELTSRQAYSRPNSRSTYTERHETPADNGARRTRAGRTIVGPVAFWRGERIVYGDGNIDGSILTLPGIKEIIRTEEVEIPRPHKRPAYRRSKPKRQPEDVEEKEEEVDEREPWETETGTVRAQVMQWDHMTGKYDEDNTEETEVAYAAEAIEMRNISGAEFQFAKTLTLPFFGSGMVDLPPGGAKRVKNSRKMQMVFFVFYGRVTVDMGTPTSSFSIGKGGMWQVPRGNFYSITNLSATNKARIFFAQGCEVAQDMGYDESQAA